MLKDTYRTQYFPIQYNYQLKDFVVKAEKYRHAGVGGFINTKADGILEFLVFCNNHFEKRRFFLKGSSVFI
jgi:hypothetical protein